LHSGY
jgi:hypothetical protein